MSTRRAVLDFAAIALLANAGVVGPFILTGHSRGGWDMQLYAATYPQQTAGLVLVDSSQAHQIERYQNILGDNIAPRSGFHLAVAPYVPPDLPPVQARRARMLAYAPITWHTAYRELMAQRASEKQIDAAPPLPSVPMIVIRRGAPMPAGGTADRAARERLWRQLQQTFVDRHPGARMLVAEKAGHYIQTEQPAIVVHGLCLVLAHVRDRRNPCHMIASEAGHTDAADALGNAKPAPRAGAESPVK